jgi:hypothetical protein
MPPTPGAGNFYAFRPDVTCNATSDEYLVVWDGDDDSNGLLNNEDEIFGQRLGYSGAIWSRSAQTISRLATWAVPMAPPPSTPTSLIPAQGHYLFVGSGYSLASYAAGDQTLATDLNNDSNVALFSSSDLTNLTSVNRLDAVGFGANGHSSPAPRRLMGKGVRVDVLSAASSNGVCNLLREGSTLAPQSGSTKEHTFYRKMCEFIQGSGCTTPGLPKDTNANDADFLYVDTAPDMSGTQRLGAPGPENLASPTRVDHLAAGGGVALLDGSVSSSLPRTAAAPSGR